MLKDSEGADTPVRVVVEFDGDLSELAGLSFKPVTTIGDISTGTIPLNRLRQLGEHPNVVTVEGPSCLKDETDRNLAAIHLALPTTKLRTLPGLGRGALIGFIDSGFELTHPCFCDEAGRTRIVAAWDQINLSGAPGAPPDGMGYGVEYPRELINRHLSERLSLVVKNHRAAGAHGTQVAGVAAGSGSPGSDYQGVAPEAELVFVTYRNDTPIGGSAFVIDAIEYILRQARARRMPAVVNLSQGDNLGAHDGSSLLEKAIDLYAEREGVLVVGSAGNEREGRRHARGRVSRGSDYHLPFEIKEETGRVAGGDIIDVWYYPEDRFAVALKDPDGLQSEFIPPDAEKLVPFGDGAAVYISSETENPANGHNRISIIFERGAGWSPGRWELILRGGEVARGDFDAWADRPDAVTLVSFTSHTDDCTVTIPGTARNIITTSGFMTTAECGRREGALAPLTSLGPTRDVRLKPDLTAPGFSVMAPTTGRAAGAYVAASGTSMAAPYVTGVVALLLAHDPKLTAARLRQALLYTARADHFTGVVPNQCWGFGKLDAGAAYEALSKMNGDGGTTMPDEKVYEIPLDVPQDAGGGNISVTVRIRVQDGNITAIEATSGSTRYVGTLTLREQSNSTTTEGGDECIVCDPQCHVVSPCPDEPATP
ncbi:MAG TPA: S8 family serine peptidase [Pyrinomonadaceae bacterium]|nr:S8 family serine peptidase [Pyrinomonadaceae bacterium]